MINSNMILNQNKDNMKLIFHVKNINFNINFNACVKFNVQLDICVQFDTYVQLDACV